MTYYFVVNLLVNTSKYYRLQKEKAVKMRWIELRKNAVQYSQNNLLESTKRDSTFIEPQKIVENYITSSNILLVTSNTLMIIANLIIMIEYLPFPIGATSDVEVYVLKLLGVGCSASWINVGSLISSLPQFGVVTIPKLGLNYHEENHQRGCVSSLWSCPGVFCVSIWRLLYVP